MSTLLLDLGNTRLKWALADAAGRPGELHAVALADDPSLAVLESLLGPAGVAQGAVLLVSSAPAREAPLLERLARHRLVPRRAQVADGFDGLSLAYRQPSKLGVDRWLAMLGARAAGPSAVLVVGCGTALTLDLVDAGGRHHGGLIAPGPALMAESLARRAPHLPEADAAHPPWTLADDTPGAIAGGCLGAAAALVSRIAADAARRLPEPPRLLLHGGAATALAPWIDTPHVVQSKLLFDGLLHWHRLAPA